MLRRYDSKRVISFQIEAECFNLIHRDSKGTGLAWGKMWDCKTSKMSQSPRAALNAFGLFAAGAPTRARPYMVAKGGSGGRRDSDAARRVASRRSPFSWQRPQALQFSPRFVYDLARCPQKHKPLHHFFRTPRSSVIAPLSFQRGIARLPLRGAPTIGFGSRRSARRVARGCRRERGLLHQAAPVRSGSGLVSSVNATLRFARSFFERLRGPKRNDEEVKSLGAFLGPLDCGDKLESNLRSRDPVVRVGGL
jgi:hypothetical protein